MTLRIGIDVGGTKIEAIALDGDGRVTARRRIATPQDDYDATVAAITALVDSIEKECGARTTVGVGTPGAISPSTGLMKNANAVWLLGQPLADDLSRALARPVRVANDANCFALSEATDGAAAGANVVFGVIVGTGTGGGIVVGGRLLVGAHAIAGEWGHNPMPWPQDGEAPGPACYCGRRGCIEQFLSGPGLARDHREATGRDWTAPEIAAAAVDDAAAELALRRYERRMARALASIINVLDPDVIVLGGGLSNLERLYDNVPLYWGEYVFSDRIDTRLVPPMHGDASGVRGAARLWPEMAAAPLPPTARPRAARTVSGL
jgi:fructokinase